MRANNARTGEGDSRSSTEVCVANAKITADFELDKVKHTTE